MKIKKVLGREIIDSRGNPTVEAEVMLENGIIARGSAPSGASKGKFEALELRDKDKSKFGGKGVTKSVANINHKILKILVGTEVNDIYAITYSSIIFIFVLLLNWLASIFSEKL